MEDENVEIKNSSTSTTSTLQTENVKKFTNDKITTSKYFEEECSGIKFCNVVHLLDEDGCVVKNGETLGSLFNWNSKAVFRTTKL